jgi:hypothetical protein
MRYRPRMAARTPRRSFATPFVVTLAAAPACYVQSAPPPNEPVPQQQQQQQQQNAPGAVVANPPRPQPVEPTPTPAVTNPPRPVDPPATTVVTNPPRPTGPAAGTTWHVFKTKDGCEAALDVSCPKGATCNPPPPQTYDCEGLSITKPITIVSEGEGICHVQPEPVHCPPGAMCNPPRPRRVACP